MKKEEPPQKSRETEVAEVCGLVAGIPHALVNASGFIREAQRRIAESTQTVGVLTLAQHQHLLDSGKELANALAIIDDIGKNVIGPMLAEGIAVTKKEVVPMSAPLPAELF